MDYQFDLDSRLSQPKRQNVPFVGNNKFSLHTKKAKEALFSRNFDILEKNKNSVQSSK